ncbi:MAG: hypothetical protein AB7L28_27125 [Kofleriaceae bacterium]
MWQLRVRDGQRGDPLARTAPFRVGGSGRGYDFLVCAGSIFIGSTEYAANVIGVG